jgi:hypothetical protein
MNPLALVRAAYGGALLLAPGTMLGLAHARRVDDPARVVAAVLGARHLAQAALLGTHGRTLRRVGVAVDLIHSGTALAFGAVDSRRRHIAWVNAAAAALLAAAGAVGSDG